MCVCVSIPWPELDIRIPHFFSLPLIVCVCLWVCVWMEKCINILWLCGVDGIASGDGAGCALICNNKKNIIINIEIINYYLYIEKCIDILTL